MITFRYQLKNVPMKIAEKNFTAGSMDFPAGSFVISGAVTPEIRAAVEQLGLTGATLDAMPNVPMHDADAPRVAIYSSWNGNAGSRLVPPHVRQLQDPLRPDLQRTRSRKAI